MGVFEQKYKNILLVILGSFIFSAGVNAFIISGNLGEGGVTGIAIVLYYAFHISPALTNFVANAILIVIGYKFLSKKYDINNYCYCTYFCFLKSYRIMARRNR